MHDDPDRATRDSSSAELPLPALDGTGRAADPAAVASAGHGSLRSASLLLWVSALALLLVGAVIGRELLAPSYARLERERMERNLERAAQLVGIETETLAGLATEYASSGDAYAYMTATERSYELAHLVPQVLADFGVRHVAFVAPGGAVRFAASIDPDGHRFVDLADGVAALWQPGGPLSGAESGGRHGLITVSGELVEAAAQPITFRDGPRPAAGAVVLLRPLDGRVLDRFSRMLQLPLVVAPGEALPAGADRVIDAPDPHHTRGILRLASLDGHPVHLEITQPADLDLQGRQVLRAAGGILAAVVLLAAAALQLLLLRLDRSRRDREALALAHRAALERLAYHDPLTGLANRRRLHDQLRPMLAVARRESWTIGFLFVDLDGFKNVNDSFGHETGDELLVRVAERLGRCVRTGDVLARLGGDEFGLLLYRAGAEDARAVAERVQEELAEPFAVAGHSLEIGASIGIALAPRDGTRFGEILNAADTAMYHAKRSGTRVSFAGAT